jgi:hypothetical protein
MERLVRDSELIVTARDSTTESPFFLCSDPLDRREESTARRSRWALAGGHASIKAGLAEGFLPTYPRMLTTSRTATLRTRVY